MNEIYHIPAMLRETIQGLNIQPSGLYVDVTFGGGGHSRAILEAAYPHPLPKGKGAEKGKAKGERQEAKGESLFEYHNTICRNVANRVKHLQEFASSNDVVIFVGGKKSSNAKVLFNNCLEVNRSTIFVSSTDDITYEIVQQCHRAEYVGICGATSTPKWLMEEIRKCIVESV